MIKAIFFDLDGTLLPVNEDEFIKIYFHLITEKVSSLGYDANTLTKTIWGGNVAMYQNDGNLTNCEVFWKYFASIYGNEKLKDKEVFDGFYTKEFKELKKVCHENKYVREIIDFCHKNVQYTILSTNPIFPLCATLTRMNFVGLKENDFDYITAYENSHYTKPNPLYFQEIMNKFNLKPNEVILFGNNTLEDGECASKCGIKCYIVGDYIIYAGEHKNDFPIIKMEDVLQTIIKEIEVNKNA